MKIIFLLLISIPGLAQVKSWYQSATNSEYGKITSQAIEDFKSISPDLYQAIDTLSIPVYIKVQDEKLQSGFSGLTTIEKDCIFIRIANTPRITKTLAHEFGHALYQFNNPNYVEFYNKRYVNRKGALGHDQDDESGRMAFKFEKQHIKDIRKWM